MSLNIEKYVGSRNKFLIKNEYEIIQNKNDDFHIVIYYLNSNKIEIIIRKLSNSSGWNYDLKIKLFANNVWNNISIGSSDENFKIMELYTNFNIEYRDHKKLYYIPKKIIQTNKDICNNLDHYNTVMSIIEKNPSYEYQFYNDIEARNFIKDNFLINVIDNSELIDDIPDVLKAYDLIICGAIKADLFRYCYLYVNGGIYIDSKISTFIDFDSIINEDDKHILCLDDAKNSLYNGLIIIEKNSYNLLQMIKSIIENTFHKKYLNDIHEPTGNKLYYKFFSDKISILNKRNNYIFHKNKLVFKCDYLNYYKINYSDFRVNYIQKNFYYYYNLYINNFIFSFDKDIKNNVFSIFHLKNNIYVLKNNSGIGWEINIKLYVFNMDNGITKLILINKNSDSEAVFTL